MMSSYDVKTKISRTCFLHHATSTENRAYNCRRHHETVTLSLSHSTIVRLGINKTTSGHMARSEFSTRGSIHRIGQV